MPGRKTKTASTGFKSLAILALLDAGWCYDEISEAFGDNVPYLKQLRQQVMRQLRAGSLRLKAPSVIASVMLEDYGMGLLPDGVRMASKTSAPRPRGDYECG